MLHGLNSKKTLHHWMPQALYDMIRKSKAFLDEELVWFAYHNDKPIAFFILYPDLNQILAAF